MNGALKTCLEYTGSGFSTASGRATCDSTTAGPIGNTGIVGSYSPGACATSGRIGSCRIDPDQPTEYYIRFLDGHDTAAATQTCAGVPGTYTPG